MTSVAWGRSSQARRLWRRRTTERLLQRNRQGNAPGARQWMRRRQRTEGRKRRCETDEGDGCRVVDAATGCGDGIVRVESKASTIAAADSGAQLTAAGTEELVRCRYRGVADDGVATGARSSTKSHSVSVVHKFLQNRKVSASRQVGLALR